MIMTTETKNVNVFRKQVTNYLDLTSKHLFMNYKKLFTIVKIDNDYYSISCDKDLTNIKFGKIDIDKQIEWYKANSKCVIKHSLFLNKKYVSIPYFKAMRESIKENINIIKK